jgi:hypothetical protein
MFTLSRSGVPLTLDIGVIDVERCEPLENVLVEVWMGELSPSPASLILVVPNSLSTGLPLPSLTIVVVAF